MLRSVELSSLIPETVEQGPSQLRRLILNHTNVDDDAAPFLSSCSLLETLEVAGTKFTSKAFDFIREGTFSIGETLGAGLFPILDACIRLETLDLTSCRGVGVVNRRRFFEVCQRIRFL